MTPASTEWLQKDGVNRHCDALRYGFEQYMSSMPPSPLPKYPLLTGIAFRLKNQLGKQSVHLKMVAVEYYLKKAQVNGFYNSITR